MNWENVLMIVCVCHRVSDREITRHAQEGKNFDDIQFELGVASQCGRCEECARNVIDQCHATQCATRPVWSPINMGMSM